MYGPVAYELVGMSTPGLIEQALEALVEKRVEEGVKKQAKSEADKIKRLERDFARIRKECDEAHARIRRAESGEFDRVGRAFCAGVRIGDVFFIHKRECLVIAVPSPTRLTPRDGEPQAGEPQETEVHVRLKLKKAQKGEQPWTKQVYSVPFARLTSSTRLRTEIQKDPLKGECSKLRNWHSIR